MPIEQRWVSFNLILWILETFYFSNFLFLIQPSDIQWTIKKIYNFSIFWNHISYERGRYYKINDPPPMTIWWLFSEIQFTQVFLWDNLVPIFFFQLRKFDAIQESQKLISEWWAAFASITLDSREFFWFFKSSPHHYDQIMVLMGEKLFSFF